jgi:hypothetical protein
MSCVLVLLMAIDVVVVVVGLVLTCCFLGVPLPPPFIFKGARLQGR